MGVLRGLAFSYERGTPAVHSLPAGSESTGDSKGTLPEGQNTAVQPIISVISCDYFDVFTKIVTQND